MTFDELLNQDATGNLRDLYMDAIAFRILVDGQPVRTRSAERAAKYPKDQNWCAMLEWDGTEYTPARGEIALKHLVSRNIPENLADYRDYILDKFHQDMTPCQHEGPCHWNKPLPPKNPDPNVHTFSRGERIENGKIVSDPPFADLLSMLADDPKPAPGFVAVENKPAFMEWTWKLPKDEGDPVYIVLSDREALQLAYELEYVERLKRGDISLRYFKDSIYVCGPGQRDLLLSERIDKDSIAGYLSYKPVVMTFSDKELEDKLAAVCISVGVVLPIEKKLTIAIRRSLAQKTEVEKLTPEELDLIQSKDRWWPPIESFRAPFRKTVGLLSASVPDMPAEVLDGWLGELCRTRMKDFPIAYAWPALLAAASVLVPKCGLRTNLFVGLIGPPRSGKDSAFNYAFSLLSLHKPLLQRLKSGSSEGLMQHIGNVEGAPRLFFPGELSQLLKRANQDGATFCDTLSDLYYNDEQDSTISKGKEIEFNCRLSLAGGIPPQSFGDLFGAATTDGLYQRFLFAECPTGFQYSYRPFDGEPAIQPQADFVDKTDALTMSVAVDSSVWDERDRWVKECGVNGTVTEHVIRAAVICASFDGRPVLYGKDLGPAFAHAKYQTTMRKYLAPNPGETNDGKIENKLDKFLDDHAPNGEWVVERTMLNSTKVHNKYGSPAVERVLQGMVVSGKIERAKSGRQKICRKVMDRLE